MYTCPLQPAYLVTLDALTASVYAHAHVSEQWDSFLLLLVTIKLGQFLLKHIPNRKTDPELVLEVYSVRILYSNEVLGRLPYLPILCLCVIGHARD